MYIAVIPQNGQANSLLFLLDGFGNSPQSVLTQTDLPKYAAQQGILTIIPLLKTGSQYFGSDAASQQSLKEMIELVMVKYHLNGKDFYIGGFSIGGTCAVKYAELAVQKNYSVKPKAVFAVSGVPFISFLILSMKYVTSPFIWPGLESLKTLFAES